MKQIKHINKTGSSTAHESQVSFHERTDYTSKVPVLVVCVIAAVAGCSFFFYGLQMKTSSNQSLIENTTRSRISQQITVSSLECRRYEKDYFLNIQNEGSRGKYLLKWNKEWATLDASIKSLRQHTASRKQSQSFANWHDAITHYQTQFLLVVEQAVVGAIDHPAQANQYIASVKDGMRQVTSESEKYGTTLDKLVDDNRTSLQESNLIIVTSVLSCIILIAGTVAWLVWSARQAAAHSRKVLGYAQRLKESMQIAKSSNTAKSEFLANMSHEIRTPMTAILGFTDILLGKLSEPEDTDAARTIKDNGEYLLNLINDILDLSKIEAGKVEVEQIGCSPHGIVADVSSLMKVRASAKGLQLEADFDSPLPESIQSDPTRLRQVLINIVGNAIKFTKTGSVKIVTRLLSDPGEEPKLRFDVIDTGIGIAEDKIEKLFLAFTQADGSTTRQFGGTGLGLTISKRLAELLGGKISVSSTIGKGSTFSVTVSTGPLDDVRLIDDAVEAAVEAVDVKVTNDTKAPLQNRRILLAEDGPDNQRLISFILKKAGAEVTLADNGQIGFDLATAAISEGCPFDVILMDMQMPVLDGYAATRRLRNDGYSGPILALTAHAMASDRQKCLDAGCDDYTAKPIDRKKLVEMVASYAMQTEVMASATPASSGI